MTIITFRDGVMAADSGGRTNDVIRNTVTKIYKCPVNGHLYGFTGSADSMSGFIEYVTSEDVHKAKQDVYDRRIPKDHNGEFGKFVVLVANAHTKSVHLLTAFGTEDYTNEPYVAIGAAAEMAMGAFYMGATARDAVSASLKHSPYAFGVVVSRSLI